MLTRSGSPVSQDNAPPVQVHSRYAPRWPSRSGSIDQSDTLPPLPKLSDPFDPEPSWQSLSRHMIQVIRHLVYSAQNGYKPHFQAHTNQVVQAIRVILYASGTHDKDSIPVQMNRQLRLHHRHLMAALSKLVLSAKMATSLWAAEATTAKMLSDAEEVHAIVRQFLQVAAAANIPLHAIDARLIPNAAAPSESGASKRLSLAFSTVGTQGVDKFGRIVSHGVLFNHLTNYARVVFRSLQILAATIRAIMTGKITNKGTVSATRQARVRAQSGTIGSVMNASHANLIVSQCHQSISHLSSCLALVSDFYTLALRDHGMINDRFFLELRNTKKILYQDVAALVTAIQLATDPMAQITVLEMTLHAAAAAEKSCVEMVASTRAVASECDVVGSLSYLHTRVDPKLEPVMMDIRSGGARYTDAYYADSPIVSNMSLPYSGQEGQSDIDVYFQEEASDHEFVPTRSRNRSNSGVSSLSGASTFSNNSGSDTPGQDQANGPFSRAYPFPINGMFTWGHIAGPGPNRLASSASSTHTAGSSSGSSGLPQEFFANSRGRVDMEQRERNIRNEKLRKLLGDDVPMAGAKKANENPWYLGHDYSHTSISFNMEGHVRGGTLQALVERLTLHDSLDTSFVATFLLSYRSFTTTEILFSLLFRRFSIPAPAALDDYEFEEWERRKLIPIRIRVLNVVKSWLELYFLEDDEDDKKMLPRVKEFAEANMGHEKTGVAAAQILRLVEKREVSDRSLRKMVLNLSTQAPQSIIPRNLKRIRFMDLDPLELARQLTIMEANFYNRIRPGECMGKAWMSTDPDEASKAANIKKLIETSNMYANWVNEIVLSEPDIKKRAAILKHLIAVADKLRQLNNFSTLSSTTAAISLSPIHRLKRTWEVVPAKSMAILANLNALTSTARNWFELRLETHSVNPPCVPFIGVYLTDLVMIEDGNSDILKRTDNHINFFKRVRVAEVIREIQQYQSVPYPLTVVPEIQAFIRRGMDRSKSLSELYDMSMVLEPRMRPMTGLPPNMPTPMFSGQDLGMSMSDIGSIVGSGTESGIGSGSVSVIESVVGSGSVSVIESVVGSGSVSIVSTTSANIGPTGDLPAIPTAAANPVSPTSLAPSTPLA
ncbi:hypothetical protein BG004_007120 [Podila humilis]|nr:hypothetical protein BG004_007120 [Podila humilis]